MCKVHIIATIIFILTKFYVIYSFYFKPGWVSRSPRHRYLIRKTSTAANGPLLMLPITTDHMLSISPYQVDGFAINCLN